MNNPRKLLFLAVMACGVAAAQQSQNSEISVLVGASNPASSVVTSGSTVKVSASVSAALHLGYGYQVHSWRAGYLYLEFPATFTFGGNTSILGSSVLSTSDNSVVWFTPGIRFKLPIHSRLSAYGVAGGGAQIRRRSAVNVGTAGVLVRTEWRITGVADVGGGLDLRLTRLLSLRGEVRDFISGGNPTQEAVYLFGLGFHF
jgi:hypothetical protein